jgi:acetolactate synthase I/II/III large subunit
LIFALLHRSASLCVLDAFPDFGLEFGNFDFVAYAKSYGARVCKAWELSTMLEAAFAEGGVHLVVVPVDYSEIMRMLVNELYPVVQAK